MDMHPPSDEELEALPHVPMTGDEPWDPSTIDEEIDESVYIERGYPMEEVDELLDSEFDDCELNIFSCIRDTTTNFDDYLQLPLLIHRARTILPKDPDYAAL